MMRKNYNHTMPSRQAANRAATEALSLETLRGTWTPVTEENRDRLAVLLQTAQAGSRVRRVSVDEVYEVAAQAEARLDVLPLAMRAGATAVYDPWSVAKSYQGAAHGTVIRLTRNTSGWVLTSIDRAFVSKRAFGRGPAQDVKVALPVGTDEGKLLGALLRGHGLSVDGAPVVKPSAAAVKTAAAEAFRLGAIAEADEVADRAAVDAHNAEADAYAADQAAQRAQFASWSEFFAARQAKRASYPSIEDAMAAEEAEWAAKWEAMRQSL